MHYVYVLKMSNEQLYIGFTNNLVKRLENHNLGKSTATKRFLPVKLIYFECYLSRKDAKNRETMLKRFGSTYSHLKKRITDSIKNSQGRG